MSVSQDSKTVLKLENVWKHFDGVAALKGVSLEVNAAEVHALLGENGAGKSTLMSIAVGSLQPDEGTIEILGVPAENLNPLETHRLGESIVYQHPALAPDLTVLENFAMALPEHFPRSDSKSRQWLQGQLASVGCTVSIYERVADLNVADRQLLEIAKALSAQPKVLILDEPTAALGARETEMLFDRLRTLAASGVGIVYITHRLVEVRAVCDTVTILRDGEVRGSFSVSDIADSTILELIVGREVATEFPPKSTDLNRDPVLLAQGLSGRAFKNVDLKVLGGEVVGIGGIIGNGQTELLRALAGLEHSTGSVRLNGESVRLRSSSVALKKGIVYLSADRLNEGLFSTLSVRENASVSTIGAFSKYALLRDGAEARAVKKEVDALAIKTETINSNVLQLSGGNQQKVIFARALLNEHMTVLLADEPSHGVDVGARAEIYKILRRIAASGVAVIVVSSDVRELQGLCDRVAVLSGGELVKELEGDVVTEENITTAIISSTVQHTDAEGGVASATSRGIGARLRRVGRGDSAAALVLATIVILVSLYTGNHNARFWAEYNLNGLALLITSLVFIAYGQAFVIMTGGIDLSVGPVAGLVAVIGSFYENGGHGSGRIVFGFVIMLAASIAVGLVNGLLVLSRVFTPIAATLVTYTALQGVSLWIRPFQGGYVSTTVQNVIQSGALGVPYSFMIAVVVALVLEHGLRRRKWGRGLRAVGSDEVAAFRLGINPRVTILRAYVLCSVLAGVGGVMLMAQIGVGDASQGINFTLASVTAVVLAGTSVFGGRGSFIGVFIGSLLVEELLNVTTFLNLGESYQYWFQGGLIFLAVGIYSHARKRVPGKRSALLKLLTTRTT